MRTTIRLTPVQMRGARAMLGWSIVKLADASGLSISTIKRMEQPEQVPTSDAAQMMVLAALEDAGVRFETRAGYGESVWLLRADRRSYVG